MLMSATSQWTGGGTDSNWSTAANWLGDAVPTNGSTLVFNSGAAQLTNVDDIAGLSVAEIQVAGGYSISGDAITLTGSSGVGIDNQSDANAFNNPITIGADLTFEQDAGQLTLGGAIDGPYGLTVAGAGTLTLSNTDSYTGATTVVAGTLLVDGAQSGSVVTVDSGAVLGGIGGTVGDVTVSGGSISPGSAASGPGILNTGNVSFVSGASYNVALDGETAGGGYDQTDATGAVDLDASTGLNVTLSDGFTPAVGDTFTIIQSTGGITGSFASLPEGTVFDAGGQSFRISYANDDVTLTCVANTSTTASPSLSTSTYGQTVTYTVTVSNTSFGGGAPTGTVELYDGSTDLGIGATLRRCAKITSATPSGMIKNACFSRVLSVIAPAPLLKLFLRTA